MSSPSRLPFRVLLRTFAPPTLFLLLSAGLWMVARQSLTPPAREGLPHTPTPGAEGGAGADATPGAGAAPGAEGAAESSGSAAGVAAPEAEPQATPAPSFGPQNPAAPVADSSPEAASPLPVPAPVVEPVASVSPVPVPVVEPMAPAVAGAADSAPVAAASVAPMDLAELARQPQLWPKQVVLRVPVYFTINVEGEVRGSVQAPAGQVVHLRKLYPDATVELELPSAQGTSAKVPAAMTDLPARVQKISREDGGGGK